MGRLAAPSIPAEQITCRSSEQSSEKETTSSFPRHQLREQFFVGIQHPLPVVLRLARRAAIRNARWLKVPLAKMSAALLQGLFRAATRERVAFLSPHLWGCLVKG